MHHLLSTAIGSAVCVCLAQPAFAAQYDDLIVFGDSLSDTGLLFEAIGFPGPPYWEGRFSNGPVWIEFLAPSLVDDPAAITNLALGGSPTALVLLLQVDSYLEFAKGTVPDDVLVILWAGANDLLGVVDVPGGDAIGAIDEAMVNLELSLTSLIDAGADEFLILNVPDLGTTPRLLDTDDDALIEGATSATIMFNESLDALLDRLEATTDISVQRVDIFEALSVVIDSPAAFGLVNVTDPALLRDDIVVRNPDEYLYWDDVHPTTVGHEYLATYVESLLIPPSTDLDGDGLVGPADLAQLLGAWGSCAVPLDCPQDLTVDGIVGPADLAILLGSWG